MKKLALFLAIMSSLSLYGQERKFEKPDYKDIDKKIRDEKSDFFYEKLFLKYNLADTSMSLDEKRALYYGFIFQPEYSPYGFSSFDDSIRDIAGKEEFSEYDYRQILRFSDSLLAENPFDLRALNYKMFCYEKLNDAYDFNSCLSKMRMIVEAIMSSGNGRTKQDAFYVIFVSHEYDLINILGLKFGGGQSLIDHYDYLRLAENDAGLEGLYFDISPSLDHLGKMFGK